MPSKDRSKDGTVVRIPLSPRELARVEQAAAALGVTVAEFVQLAVTSALDNQPALPEE